MAGQIQTTTPGMRQASTTMDTTKGNIESDRSQVSAALATLAGSWQGNASSAFSNATQPWFDDVAKILNKLQEMSELLEGNRGLIERTEDDATTNASALAGAIGMQL